jgi:glyoxylase-like metal-dependent hydrolase (beta-lactamase superfamily II)
MWIRMPIPFAPGHINLWAIEDGIGWAIVDTGMETMETKPAWRNLFSGSLGSEGVTRIFVTHMHRDHVGMAGWLTREFDCRLWMTRLEYLTCQLLINTGDRKVSDANLSFYRKAGWEKASLEHYQAQFGNLAKTIHPLPDSFRCLQDKEILIIGDHLWTVVVGSGHSPEHACLYCPELKVLISGDQVLPRISSNVSVLPHEPEADPLADWLASLEKLKRKVPNDVLVLPAHHEPFFGLHERLDSLASGKVNALNRLRLKLQKPQRVVDTFPALFSRQIRFTDHALLVMATGESIAYINYLMHRGEVMAQLDDDGVAWYRNTR